jgi:16S rRNA (guanine527-N7)-methyltransferase
MFHEPLNPDTLNNDFEHIELAAMTPEELLKQGLTELRISGSEKQVRAFLTYLSELKKWNRAYNLTGLKTDDDIIIKHFLDSLLYIRALPPSPFHLADIGAGAGFPGIPVKIMMPEMELTLVESSRKKASFLRNMVRTLELKQVTVLEERIEHLGNAFGQSFDTIVSRATFSIREFLTAACPYVKTGGTLILNKGPKIRDELIELEKYPAMKRCVKELLHCTLPVRKTERNLVVLVC